MIFPGISCVYLIRFRNSFLVLAELRNIPEKADVVVMAFDFCTPRSDMQVCIASMTTATPRGFSASTIQSLIWTVSLSWTWSLLAYVSTTLAILLRPVILPLGI